MLVPMIVLAGLCVLFGVVNQLPLGSLIQPAVGQQVTGGASFAGFPASATLVGLTLLALTVAVVNHIFGVRRTGRGLGAVDHIHHAPVLASIYDVAEKGRIDPYTIGRWVVKGIAAALWSTDRAIDWFYETVVVGSALGISRIARFFHNGSVNRYVLWSIAGAAAVVFAALAVLGGGK
jgi:NADH-quinone oxidoreductase subunit L